MSLDRAWFSSAPLGKRSLIEDTDHTDHAGQGAHGVGAAAEPEKVDAVAGRIVAHQEGIELQHVAAVAPTERAAEDLQRQKALRSHAVAVKDDLFHNLAAVNCGPRLDRWH